MIVIYTIGHSNRSADQFLRLLLKYGVEYVADIRRFPKSRHPHFSGEELVKILSNAGIEYGWFEELGGYRRKVLRNSPHIAIKSPGFRNYADHMMSEEFRKGVGRLLRIASERRVAIMCAERFFWKCHRKFVSDYLVASGVRVLHILDDGVREHRLSREARVADSGGNKIIIYDVIENPSAIRSTL